MKSDTGGAVRVGLIGFGTVGRAFARLLAREAPDLAVPARRPSLPRGRRDPQRGTEARSRPRDRRALDGRPRFRRDGRRGSTSSSSCSAESSPRTASSARRSDAGKSVVTANKMLLARHGTALQALAREKGAGLGIEAAVAGGIPILRALRASFTGDRVTAVSGILNGTCNFILTEMEKTERPYDEVLAEAQRLGIRGGRPGERRRGRRRGLQARSSRAPRVRPRRGVRADRPRGHHARFCRAISSTRGGSCAPRASSPWRASSRADISSSRSGRTSCPRRRCSRR